MHYAPCFFKKEATLEDFLSFYEKGKGPISFSAIRISIASPEKIESWSMER